MVVEAVFTGVLALAFLVPLATGTYDLAIGANMSMALVISSYLSSTDKTPDLVAMFIALGACAIAGLVSGFFVVKLKVNSFIATLGMSQVITAFVQKTSSQSINEAFTDGYRDIGRQELFGLPLYVYYLGVLAIIVWYVFEHTPVGRHMFADRRQPRSRPPRRSAHRPPGLGVARRFRRHRRVRRASSTAGRSATTRRRSAPATCSRRSPPCSSVRRSSRDDPTCGARSSRSTRWRGASRGCSSRSPSNTRWIEPLFQGASLLAAVSLASRQQVIKVPRRKTPLVDEPPASIAAPAEVPT